MTLTKLYIDGVEQPYLTLSYSDYVDRIGSWNARLIENKEMDGYCTVTIEEDGVTVFQGMLVKPAREIARSGQNMSVGGPEWTARLMHHLTPGDTSIEDSVSDTIDTIMANSPFSLGEVDSWDIELDATTWETTLEFLGFTYSTMCIVYDTGKEVEAQVHTGTDEFPPPSLRACFWYGGTTKRFYIIFYDEDADKLQYTHSEDGETWSAAADFTGATPAASEGDNGTFGVYWDGTTLHMLVDDGANIDYWTGSINDGTGVITLAKTSDSFDTGDLVCGPVPDNSGHIWCCVYDGVNYVLWEYVAGWTAMANGANEVKQMFPQGTDGDMIVIEWDSGEGDIEEYRWDRSAGTYSHYVDVVTSISGTSIGYICGYWDYYYNIYMYWEDVYAGGDADIRFSWRMVDETTWESSEKVVDDDQYQSPGNFSVAGDHAGNTYLYYQWEESGGVKDLHVIRRLEETHEATVKLEDDILDNGHIQAVQRGLGLFVAFLNGGADVRFILHDLEGATTYKRYDNPWFFEDHEATNAYTGSYVASGCSLSATDTTRPFSGTKNLKATIPAGASTNKNCVYYKYLPSTSEMRTTLHLSARYVRWNADMDTDNHWTSFLSAGETTTGMALAYFGIRRSGGVVYWACYYYNGGLVWHVSATVAEPNKNYNIEAAMYRNAGAGWVKLWVDGVLVIDLSGLNTLHADRELKYARFGAGYADAPDDSDLIVTMDDCRINHKRIGTYQSGNVYPPTHTASAAMEEWGTLDSIGSNNYDTKWYIYDEVMVLLLSWKTVPLDLEAAGLSNTEDEIIIRPYMVSRFSAKTYVSMISLSERGSLVSLNVDYENVYLGLNKLADLIGAEFKLDYDDTLDFLTALGEDKSSSVAFFTARSASQYPDTKPNIEVVSRTPDWGYYANCIRVVGGSGASRVEATAKDEDEIEEMSGLLGGNHNGEIWYVVRDPDTTSTAMAQSRALVELAKRNVLYERIQAVVVESESMPKVVRGDTVTLLDRWTALDTTARIVGVTVNYDGRGYKTVSLEFVQRARSTDYPKHVGRIEDLLRYATA